jgi:hypothetical protein
LIAKADASSIGVKSRLTDEIRQFIRAHKPELLAYLKRQHAANDSGIPPCASPDELARMVQHDDQALHAGAVLPPIH